MRTLTLKIGEDVLIGDNILVQVLDYKMQEGRVVLGFNAPKDVRIVRGEVADRDARAREDARARGKRPTVPVRGAPCTQASTRFRFRRTYQPVAPMAATRA